MIHFIISTYHRLTQFFRNMRLISALNANGLAEMAKTLETVYPGFKAYLSKLVDRRERHMVDCCFTYINANGGVKRLADYYSTLDEEGKEHLHASVSKAFRDGDAFESQVIFLDKISKMKGYGTLGQLMCDLKDGIIKSSLKSGKRTIDDWRLFLRREQECGSGLSLAVLDEIEQCQKQASASKEAERKVAMKLADFSVAVIDHLYNEYDNVVFKHISSISEFRSIILRLPHSERLVECTGRKTHLYHIIWRLHKLPPTRDHSWWLDDICSECGFNVTTLSKKYNDSSTMSGESRKILEQLSSYFDYQDKNINKLQ